MKEEDKIQLIEDYINGHLSMQEKADFQQQMQQDPFLAQEVDLYRNILSGIAESSKREMKAHFKALDAISFRQPQADQESDQTQPQTDHVTARNKPLWQKNIWLTSLAACLVLGLVAVLWLASSSSTEELFAQYYSPYQNVVNAIERGETTQDLKKQAMQAYENADYASAVEGLQQVLRTNPDDRLLYLYLGISYIETNQLDSAKTYLEKAAADTGSGLHTQARWYLALAHLKNKDKEQAKTQLQLLSREKDIHAQRARQLLDEL